MIPDDLGVVIQTGSGRRNLAYSPLLIELAACIKGISAAVQLGINNIILKMDAQQVVGALQGDEFRQSLVEALCMS